MSTYLQSFPRNVANTKFEQGEGHWKLRNGHGKVMGENIAAKSVRTLKQPGL